MSDDLMLVIDQCRPGVARVVGGDEFDGILCGTRTRRVVACVNRLAGFKTEHIEDAGYDLFHDTRPRLENAEMHILVLLKQRDALIAALEQVIAISDRKDFVYFLGSDKQFYRLKSAFAEPISSPEIVDAWDRAKAAIAACKTTEIKETTCA
jgi:hypothetical protein